MTHPDEVVKLICALAKDHGYGVVSLDMRGHKSGLGVRPMHSYGFDYVDVQNAGGERQSFVIDGGANFEQMTAGEKRLSDALRGVGKDDPL